MLGMGDLDGGRDRFTPFLSFSVALWSFDLVLGTVVCFGLNDEPSNIAVSKIISWQSEESRL